MLSRIRPWLLSQPPARAAYGDDHAVPAAYTHFESADFSVATRHRSTPCFARSDGRSPCMGSACHPHQLGDNASGAGFRGALVRHDCDGVHSLRTTGRLVSRKLSQRRRSLQHKCPREPRRNCRIHAALLPERATLAMVRGGRCFVHCDLLAQRAPEVHSLRSSSLAPVSWRFPKT